MDSDSPTAWLNGILARTVVHVLTTEARTPLGTLLPILGRGTSSIHMLYILLILWHHTVSAPHARLSQIQLPYALLAMDNVIGTMHLTMVVSKQFRRSSQSRHHQARPEYISIRLSVTPEVTCV